LILEPVGNKRDPGVSPELSRAKRIGFLIAAILIPVSFFPLLELGLRLGGYGESLPVFTEPPYRRGGYLAPNPRLGFRYFWGELGSPPTAPEPFLARKPDHAFRVFVLGESTARGYPYSRNGTFSRILRDALTDAMPRDTVEVINLSMTAVSSFVLSDIADEVIHQRPDLLIVYSGHNEYYGVLGAASTDRVGGSPAVVRAVVRLQRLRTMQLFRGALRRIVPRRPAEASTLVSRMDSMAGTSEIPFGSREYARGLTQFGSNLGVLLERARRAQVPVLVGSQASNLRDQAPFGSIGSSPAANADSAFSRARAALSRGDTLSARNLFRSARDLDVVRWRAPSALDSVIRAVVKATGATYVPTAETIAGAAPDSIPGSELFFEHVHPRQDGVLLLAKAYLEAILHDSTLSGRFDRGRIRSFDEYRRRMELTEVDHLVARISVDMLKSRWPFAPRGTTTSFIAGFQARTQVDSAAFAIAIGVASWSSGKLEMAKRYLERGLVDSAVAEYRGLARDAPWNPLPPRRAGLALEKVHRDAEAVPFLREALRLGDGPEVMAALLRIEARRRRD
jgi:hypothetical protein